MLKAGRAISMSWGLALALSLSSILLNATDTDAWTTPKVKLHDVRHTWHLRSHSDNDNGDRYSRYPGGEVIGSAGKIGSYILHRLNTNTPIIPITSNLKNDGEAEAEAEADNEAHRQNNPQPQQHPYPQSLHAASVPRGVSPGCLSPNDTPIYACIPSSSIVDVWDSTLPHRRKDLVFLCNCIPSRHLTFFDCDSDHVNVNNVTIAILHFGVSNGRNTNYDHVKSLSSLPTPQLNNSPQSPPTVIYGKHARILGDLLRKDGICVHVARDPNEVQVAAARKMAWSSLMWLMCHSHGGDIIGDGDGDGDGDDGELQPLRVKDVHEHKSKQLQTLVEEILPALEHLASESWMKKSEECTDTTSTSTLSSFKSTIGSTQEILDYLRSYSMSISNGNVIPSRELALREIQERNGLLLSLMKKTAPAMTTLPPKTDGGKDHTTTTTTTTPSYHLDLIRQLAGEKVLAKCLDASPVVKKNQDKSRNNDGNERFQRVQCTSSDLEFLFRSNNKSALDHDSSSTPKSAVIIGAGMMGSSIAYHLSRRGINVTVMDQRTNVLPPPRDCGSSFSSSSENNHDIDAGTATSSTFAWLNANDKLPLSYKQLNQLGMEVWRRHSILKHLPVWCGSLVRSSSEDEAGNNERSLLRKSPYYVRVGPLDQASSRHLEPGIDWSSSVSEDTTTDASAKESEIHFYPEEGHVDPVEAVKALRLSARDNGVDFLEGVQIKNLVRDENDKVIGMEHTTKAQDGGRASQSVLTTADVVIIAAGANSSDPILGIGTKRLQLLEQPGFLAYAKSTESDDNETDESKTLKRIFVDTIAQAHILRRPDKTIVVGGGELVVGGGGKDESLNRSRTPENSASVFTSSQKSIEEDLIGNAMINNAATAIDPFELKLSSPRPSGYDVSPRYELVRVSRANRPMPSDGLPVLGFVEQGLYVAVMHSGMTLGALAGELVSYEVWDDVLSSATKEQKCEVENNGFQILDDYRPSRFSIKN